MSRITLLMVWNQRALFCCKIAWQTLGSVRQWEHVSCHYRRHFISQRNFKDKKIDREDIQCATIIIALTAFLIFWWGFVYLANAIEHACNLTRNPSKGTGGLKMGANTGDCKQGEKSIPYIAIFICVCVCAFFDLFFKRISRLSMKGHVPVVHVRMTWWISF